MGLTNGLTKANICCPEPHYLHFAVQNASVFILQRPDFAHSNVPGKSKRPNSIHKVTNVHTCKITALAFHGGDGTKTQTPQIKHINYLYGECIACTFSQQIRPEKENLRVHIFYYIKAFMIKCGGI